MIDAASSFEGKREGKAIAQASALNNTVRDNTGRKPGQRSKKIAATKAEVAQEEICEAMIRLPPKGTTFTYVAMKICWHSSVSNPL
jgi:hypothetical protein